MRENSFRLLRFVRGLPGRLLVCFDTLFGGKRHLGRLSNRKRMESVSSSKSIKIPTSDPCHPLFWLCPFIFEGPFGLPFWWGLLKCGTDLVGSLDYWYPKVGGASGHFGPLYNFVMGA